MSVSHKLCLVFRDPDSSGWRKERKKLFYTLIIYSLMSRKKEEDSDENVLLPAPRYYCHYHHLDNWPLKLLPSQLLYLSKAFDVICQEILSLLLDIEILTQFDFKKKWRNKSRWKCFQCFLYSSLFKEWIVCVWTASHLDLFVLKKRKRRKVTRESIS